MDYIIMGIAAAVVIAALMFFTNSIKGLPSKAPAAKKNLKKTTTKCPLCGSFLLEGENLFSKIYRPMNVPDQRCTISGCPHCFPSCESGVQRVCPVCHKKVPAKGYLIARLFNKTDSKKHVLVTGCTECMKNFSKNT